MEEDVRFELTDPFGPSVFKTDAIGHSANLPIIMADSIGFEPMRHFRNDGLANRSFNHSGNYPSNLVREAGFEPTTYGL